MFSCGRRGERSCRASDRRPSFRLGGFLCSAGSSFFCSLLAVTRASPPLTSGGDWSRSFSLPSCACLSSSVSLGGSRGSSCCAPTPARSQGESPYLRRGSSDGWLFSASSAAIRGLASFHNSLGVASGVRAAPNPGGVQDLRLWVGGPPGRDVLGDFEPCLRANSEFRCGLTRGERLVASLRSGDPWSRRGVADGVFSCCPSFSIGRHGSGSGVAQFGTGCCSAS
mmetsp:Transcript_42802/g.98110  ORF Transcript_42802/g.98110 Transcript_42802/m.98110 type:complete len:225 (+) Transcript_42802:1364-2038(+)